MGKVTKKMLEEYRKTKADIPILQAELENMRQGEAGIGTSVIMDYKKGYPRPQSVSGFDWPLYERRQKALQKKPRTVAPAASSECITSRGLDGRKSLPSLDIMVNQIIQG